jgi:hypothetical protein
MTYAVFLDSFGGVLIGAVFLLILAKLIIPDDRLTFWRDQLHRRAGFWS